MIPAAKLDRLLDRFAAIEAEMASGMSGEAFVKLSREHAELSPVIATARDYRSAQIELAGTEAMIADPAGDSEMRAMAEQERADLRARLEILDRDLKIQLLPRDAADDSSAIVEIRAGTGGDEAALFAADLLEMYQRWCGLQGWKTEVMDRTDSDLGGIKDATLEVNGRGAFARLKFESGVHRVQRVPATENQGRIHTSAATVAVLPEAEDVDIVINDKDLRIDVYRAQGAGGQHVNKTESAVRITHLPTGIAVAQQTEKSQHKNKAHAMKLLKAKLYDMERNRVDSARAADRKSMVGSGDRSERIRTYNFPQGRVTDHRINLTLYNLARIISGDELGEIVDALVAQDQADRLAQFEAMDFLSALANDAVLDAARRLAAAGIDSARLDARLLWSHAQMLSSPVHGGGAAQGAAEGEAAAAIFDRLLARRLAREPVAAITGHKEFWSLDFEVGRGVLIPRPDTETLIEEALRLVPDRNAHLRIADLGTGSGAILLAALSEFPNATGIGFESAAQAHGYAARNAARLAPGRAEMRLADWNTAQGPFDLVFSNPPYIPSPEIALLEPDVRDHEPRAALDGGPDGLDAYRGLGTLLPVLLALGGFALLEIGAGQEGLIGLGLFPGLEFVRLAPDLSGIGRCMVLRCKIPWKSGTDPLDSSPKGP